MFIKLAADAACSEDGELVPGQPETDNAPVARVEISSTASVTQTTTSPSNSTVMTGENLLY